MSIAQPEAHAVKTPPKPAAIDKACSWIFRLLSMTKDDQVIVSSTIHQRKLISKLAGAKFEYSYMQYQELLNIALRSQRVDQVVVQLFEGSSYLSPDKAKTIRGFIIAGALNMRNRSRIRRFLGSNIPEKNSGLFLTFVKNRNNTGVATVNSLEKAESSKNPNRDQVNAGLVYYPTTVAALIVKFERYINVPEFKFIVKKVSYVEVVKMVLAPSSSRSL